MKYGFHESCRIVPTLRKEGAVKPQATIRWNDPRHRSTLESHGAVPATPRHGGALILNGSHPPGGSGEDRLARKIYRAGYRNRATGWTAFNL